jgi:RimJ/RimL family protein N-acetyltransferase
VAARRLGIGDRPDRGLHPVYPIETRRLTLRPFTTDDLDDLYAFHRLPEVARFLYWDARDLDETREVLHFKVGQTGLDKEGDRIIAAVVLRESGRVIGEVTLKWTSREHMQGEVGFVVNPEFQGRGVAAEAAREMLWLGFDGLGLHRIIGRCDARNEASARLMQRLGMRREAHLVENEMFKGEWSDEYVYAMLGSEWRAAGAAAYSSPAWPQPPHP